MRSGYPEGFRYSADMDAFKKSVDYSKELLKTDQISILFGCISDVNIILDRNTYEKNNYDIDFKTFSKIFKGEIISIMTTVLEEGEQEAGESLTEFLQEKDDSEINIEDILKLYREKTEYVKEALICSDIVDRYCFKAMTVSDKLSSFDWNINKFVFDDHDDEIKYAQVRIAASKNLVDGDLPYSLSRMLKANQPESEVKFVCDKNDVNYLIKQLEKIRDALQKDDV